MPYPEFNDIEGMMSIEELRWLSNIAKEMDSIVELGCWFGRSTHALLTNCRGIVYAIDPWSPSYIGPRAQEVRKGFFENTKDFKNLVIMEMESAKAVKAFADKSVDMVFVDADHSQKSVIQDNALWLPKARKIICGHDYNPEKHSGVVQAVDKCYTGRFKLVDTIWYVNL